MKIYRAIWKNIFQLFKIFNKFKIKFTQYNVKSEFLYYTNLNDLTKKLNELIE